MEPLEAIKTRRSIRRYTPQLVPEGMIIEVLRAAMSAPSAGDERPWQFVVITDQAILIRISEIHPYAQMAREAPVAVLVCGDLRLEKHPGFWVQDCAAATENLLLAAHAMGLGAVWVGICPVEARIRAFRELLDIPPVVVPFALVPLGYPAERKEGVDRTDPARIHWNRWNATTEH